MAKHRKVRDPIFQRLRWPLWLTWVGLLAERATLAFWPFLTLCLSILATLMFGGHLLIPLELVWMVSVLLGLGVLASLAYGFYKFRWPTGAQALARIDANLPNRPITALLDQQAIGADDAQSQKVWDAHRQRMLAMVSEARHVTPDIHTPRADPFALRYVALLAFVLSLVFGSVWRLTSLDELTAGPTAYGATSSWEGWVEPPAYTGKPSIYLPDITTETLRVPVGSRMTLRLYGEVGRLTVVETVSARTTDIGSVAQPNQSFEIAQSGRLDITGPAGRSWTIEAIADQPPSVSFAGPIERSVRGEMKVPFAVSDDYGVQQGQLTIHLDLDHLDRKFGFVHDPEPVAPVVLDLPMPFRGDRTQFQELLVENLSEHPWAGLPVSMVLSVTDARDQTGRSQPTLVPMPGRKFFDPLAAALVEQRQYLLWSRENAPDVARVLRAVSHYPDDIFPSGSDYLQLRVAIRRLEAAAGELDTATQQEVAAALWKIALTLEEGDLADARARLDRAQERLEQAMRDGATDDEIAELMQDLNEAMQDYLQQLAQEQANNPDQTSQNQDGQEITNQQLQDMLDQIQELMEQGRMAEAQQLMEQLREMMDNMQVTQGDQGQSGPGQQSMQDLADTLRQQQDLSDETFQDLQDSFGEDGQEQQGQQGQSGQQGEPGQQGQQGQQGENGQPGQGGTGGQQGQLPGQNGTGGTGPQQGDGAGRGAGNNPAPGLADRQRALRDQLDRQSRNLPGGSGSDGSGAQGALRRAQEAMEGAENALEQQDYAGALDEQGKALEAMREGMRDLAQDLAQQQNQRTGQQGDAAGRAQAESNRDPLGRDAGAAGRIGTDQRLLQGQDVYRRAQELLDEIRRRSSDQKRPGLELDYLRRLLDQF